MKRDIRWLPFTVGLLLLFVWLSGLAVAQVASENDIALCHGSVELARAGNIVEAERLAARISNEYRKAVAYGQIAIGQAMAGHFAEAEATIAKHCRNHNNSNIYRWIAEAQIQANDLSGAKTSVTHVNPENGREIILHQIADAQAKAGDMTGAKATRALIKKEFGDPGMEKFIEILLLLVVAILGTTAVLLYVADRWRRGSQFLAALALFLAVPAGYVSVVPIPFFALLLDDILGGRGFGVMSDRYWQPPESLYALLTLFMGAAVAFGVGWATLRCASWMRHHLGRATWFMSFPLFVVGVIVFSVLMFLVLVAMQYIGVYESCLWLPWEHGKL